MSLKVNDVLNRYSGKADVSVWSKQVQLTNSWLKLKDLAGTYLCFLTALPSQYMINLMTKTRHATKIAAALKTAFATDKLTTTFKIGNGKVEK